MSDDESAPVRGHCPNCAADRRAVIRGQHREDFEDEQQRMWWVTTSSILECAGCSAVYFQRVESSSEDNEDGAKIQHWPLPAKRARPKWSEWNIFSGLDQQLVALLREIYDALDNGLCVLATIGMRTALELSMTLLKIPDDTFSARLRKMVEAHHIGESQRASLEVLTEAGNAAAHRSWKPDQRQLNILMDVLEPFLHHAFVVHAQAEALRGKVPRKGQPEAEPDGMF